MTAPPAAPAPLGSERRRADRKPLRTQATVFLPGQQQFEVRTLDVSPGGLGILASANPRPGTAFQLQFKLPLKTGPAVQVTVLARVVHSVFSSEEGGFKVGLMFVQLSPEAAQAIVRFMR